MSYLSEMSKEEIEFICSAIPLDVIIGYFTKNPKSFQKIRPGFRPKAILKEDAEKLLARNVDNDFVSKFLEGIIGDWLSEIETHYLSEKADGSDEISAWIGTLAQSFFSSETDLYFKLACKKLPKTETDLINTAVNLVSKSQKEVNKLSLEIQEKESIAKIAKSKLEISRADVEKQKGKLEKKQTEIERLKKELSDSERQRRIEGQHKKDINELEKRIVEHEETIQSLNKELAIKISDMSVLETRIREDLEKQRAESLKRAVYNSKPKRPSSVDEMDEFIDLLVDNLKNLGIQSSDNYYILLRDHLKNILFNGVPIVVNSLIGKNVIKCIGNSLIENQDVMTLKYEEGMKYEDIRCFMAQSDRIVCLDCFLGNYNEVELLTALSGYADRIVFCTVAYDKTLRYIPIEFQEHTYYFNASRINALTRVSCLTEEPSRILEEEYEAEYERRAGRPVRIFREILNELGYPNTLIESKMNLVASEADLWCVLAFDILPYCVDVMQIKPFNRSEKLQKYILNSERCPHRALFEEWFAS